MTIATDARIREIATDRREGRLNAAVTALNALLPECPDDQRVLQEAMKIALLNRQPDTAYRCYLQLAPTEDLAHRCDPVSAARMACSIPGASVRVTEPAGPEPAWLERYRRTGEDVPFDSDVRAEQVSVLDENAVFDFGVRCGCCGADSRMTVYVTLVSEPDRLCPSCLARQRVSVEGMSAAAASLADGRLRGATPALDRAARSLVQSIYVDRAGQDLPLVCRLLGHDYLPLLNEFMVARMVDRKVTER